jgi:D-alanyl-D-alanine endopeptidase (penicillin-binding protein 7)
MKQLFLVAVAFFATTVLANVPVSTVVYNQTKDEFMVADNADRVRPIASITKIMTAIVALEHYQNLDQKLNAGSVTKLPSGMISVENLLTATLVRSDNGASDVLANHYPGGRSAFIRAMNKRAKQIGAVNMRFRDPTGLSAGNVATAREVALLMQESLKYPFIGAGSTLKQAIFEHHTPRSKRTTILPNTNKLLLYDYEEIVSSKTGFTRASGWSVSMMLDRQGQQFTVVILGARDPQHRYEIAKSLIEKHFIEIDTYVLTQQLQENLKDSINEDELSFWGKIRGWWDGR